MKEPFPFQGSSSGADALRSALGYVCAVVFAWLAAQLTLHIAALQGTPVALNFLVAAGITSIFGMGPGIVSVVATAALFYDWFILPSSRSDLSPGVLIRVALILSIGFLIVYFFDRLRNRGIRLRSALSSLSDHADTLAQAQQGSNSAAWVIHVKRRSIEWAKGGAEILGRPSQEVTTLDALIQLVSPDDRVGIERLAENAIRTGTPFQSQFRILLPNGEMRWLEARGTPSPSASHWRGVVMDITTRRNAEIAVLRSEKLAAIGRLSATVAHEINNPLEAATNLIYLASLDTTMGAEARAYLADAERELHRLANIARHTLTFARTKPTAGPTEIGPIIESVVSMFQARCNSRGGRVHYDATASPQVDVPPDELRQILTNLLSNACDVLIGGEGLVDVTLSSADGTTAVIIRDSGVGIPDENLERIFDPFFTTKNDVGTGIGLWVTKELVEKNGGTITVVAGDHAAPFRTCFRVEFPVAQNSL
ncbi:MAG: ATP-binding protein [Acidobacteriaceae bacterium]